MTYKGELNMLNWLNIGINYLISLVLLMSCYIFLPSMVSSIAANSVLAYIFLLPLAIIFGLATSCSVVGGLVVSIVSKKWYFITLSAIILVIFLLVALTSFGVIPKII